jgi:hypothetical protein
MVDGYFIHNTHTVQQWCPIEASKLVDFGATILICLSMVADKSGHTTFPRFNVNGQWSWLTPSTVTYQAKFSITLLSKR